MCNRLTEHTLMKVGIRTSSHSPFFITSIITADLVGSYRYGHQVAALPTNFNNLLPIFTYCCLLFTDQCRREWVVSYLEGLFNPIKADYQFTQLERHENATDVDDYCITLNAQALIVSMPVFKLWNKWSTPSWILGDVIHQIGVAPKVQLSLHLV